MMIYNCKCYTDEEGEHMCEWCYDRIHELVERRLRHAQEVIARWNARADEPTSSEGDR